MGRNNGQCDHTLDHLEEMANGANPNDFANEGATFTPGLNVRTASAARHSGNEPPIPADVVLDLEHK